MRLVLACILIAGFQLPWFWYLIAFAVWSVPLVNRLVSLPDLDEIAGWWEELRNPRRGK